MKKTFLRKKIKNKRTLKKRMKGGMWTNNPLLSAQPLPLGLGPPPTAPTVQPKSYTYGEGQRAREARESREAREAGEGGGGAEEVGGGAEPDGLEEYNSVIDEYKRKTYGDEIINFGSLTDVLTLDEKGLLEKEYIVEGGYGAEEGSEGYGAGGGGYGSEGYGGGYSAGGYALVINSHNENGYDYGKLDIVDTSTGVKIDTQIRIDEKGQLLDYNSQSLEPYNSEGGDRPVYIQYNSNLSGYPQPKNSILYIKLSTGILYYNGYETAYLLNKDGVLIERVHGKPVTVE